MCSHFLTLCGNLYTFTALGLDLVGQHRGACGGGALFVLFNFLFEPQGRESAVLAAEGCIVAHLGSHGSRLVLVQ